MHYRITKLVAINIFAFIGILVTLNLSVIIIFQCYKGISSMMRDNDNNTNCTRSNLPNYSEIDWAKIHFNELGKLESEYKSYIGWRRSGFSGQTININDEGIRHTPQSELVTEHSPLVVFLGGSIINHGGQNPLEPARLGCKILHGPNIQNFTEVYNLLDKNNLSSKFHSTNQLIKLINEQLLTTATSRYK